MSVTNRVTCHGRVTAMSLPTDVRTYGRDVTRHSSRLLFTPLLARLALGAEER